MTIPTRKAPPQSTVSPTTYIPNPYVKSENIKNSFLTLTAEIDKYRKGTKNAKDEHQKLLHDLSVAQQRSNALLQQVRKAQDQKGLLHRQVELLENQYKNLQKHIAKERQTSQQLSDDLADIAQTMKKEREKHLETMNDLNTTLKDFLQQIATKRYDNLLHPFAVQDIENIIKRHNSSLVTPDTLHALHAMGKAGNAYYAAIDDIHAIAEEIKNWRRRLQNDNDVTTTQVRTLKRKEMYTGERVDTHCWTSSLLCLIIRFCMCDSTRSGRKKNS
jgi:hypothetical protein